MSITASNLDVTLHRKAVHSEAGKELTFGNIPNNPGGVGIVDGGQDSTRSVKSVRLDDVFGASGDIVFMKVDTEGNEFHVLKSAENLLSGQQIKYMVVEVRPSQVEMVNYLYEYGYTCSLIRDARSREAVTCRSTSLENLLMKLQRIEAFSDMFCCIGVPKKMCDHFLCIFNVGPALTCSPISFTADVLGNTSIFTRCGTDDPDCGWLG